MWSWERELQEKQLTGTATSQYSGSGEWVEGESAPDTSAKSTLLWSTEFLRTNIINLGNQVGPFILQANGKGCTAILFQT